MNRNKKILTAILVLLVMCTGISISYAFFKVASSNNGANTNVTINGAALCMSLQQTSENVTLSNEYAVPISDSKALSTDTYKTSVTIENNCSTSQSFNLLLVPNSSNTMPIKALKSFFGDDSVTVSTSGVLISEEYILDSTIQKQLLSLKNETLKTGFAVGGGTVSANTSKTFYLYLWIDKDEGGLGNGSTMNKSLNAYLTLGSGSVIGTQIVKGGLYKTIENRYNKDKTYLGLYTGEGSEDYPLPVYYYKGNVQNNNVLFGGFCWKIVRTTETGGVKIVYNGVQKDVYESYEKINSNEYTIVSNDETYPYTFDSTNKVWKSNILDDSGNGTDYTIELSPTQDGSYLFNINMHNESEEDSVELYLNDDYIGYGENCGDGCFMIDDTDSINLSLSTSDVIKIIYYKGSTTTDNSDYVDFSLQKGIGNTVKSCNNTGTDSQIGTSVFNNDHNSPAYVGYKHNTVYPTSSKSMSSQSNIVFGNSFTYTNGTYTLKDTKTVATWSSGYNTINNNHYTCMTTGTTCSSIYYVYFTESSWAYYITLTNGKSVNDALNEMLYADDVNTNDSAIKAYIDSWYENNLTRYEGKLEDTVFCNDRSMSNESSNGWNPNGGSTSTYLYFKNSNTSNQSLVCANETDRFSISNPKAKLKHPIGLLSVPELRLAGYGSSHYFNNRQYVWLASPFSIRDAYYDGVWGVYDIGWKDSDVYNSGGVRPSVSIKPGISFSSGDGSYTSPFVIE